jgi:hypothetical protein
MQENRTIGEGRFDRRRVFLETLEGQNGDRIYPGAFNQVRIGATTFANIKILKTQRPVLHAEDIDNIESNTTSIMTTHNVRVCRPFNSPSFIN